MITEYRIAEHTAIAERDGRWVMLALDGALDPRPVVIEGSGVVICETLRQWVTLEALSRAVAAHYDVDLLTVTDGVQGLLQSLCEFGIIVSRSVTLSGPSEVPYP